MTIDYTNLHSLLYFKFLSPYDKKHYETEWLDWKFTLRHSTVRR